MIQLTATLRAFADITGRRRTLVRSRRAGTPLPADEIADYLFEAAVFVAGAVDHGTHPLAADAYDDVLSRLQKARAEVAGDRPRITEPLDPVYDARQRRATVVRLWGQGLEYRVRKGEIIPYDEMVQYLTERQRAFELLADSDGKDTSIAAAQKARQALGSLTSAREITS
jgi:hypothetical protein